MKQEAPSSASVLRSLFLHASPAVHLKHPGGLTPDYKTRNSSLAAGNRASLWMWSAQQVLWLNYFDNINFDFCGCPTSHGKLQVREVPMPWSQITSAGRCQRAPVVWQPWGVCSHLALISLWEKSACSCPWQHCPHWGVSFRGNPSAQWSPPSLSWWWVKCPCWKLLGSDPLSLS